MLELWPPFLMAMREMLKQYIHRNLLCRLRSRNMMSKRTRLISDGAKRP